MGGIVTRYLLEKNSTLLSKKNIGLVLLTSPSRGSEWADRFGLLAALFKNKMANELSFNNPLLRDLDGRFLDLKDRNPPPFPVFEGVDLYEEKFIIPGFFRDKEIVVDSAKQTSYFGSGKIIGKSNHFTIAKPESRDSASHERLVEFYLGKYLSALALTATTVPKNIERRAIDILARDFIGGVNVGIDKCTTGPGILGNAFPCDAAPNIAEFKFNMNAAGNYRLDINYAAATSRPLNVSINSKPIFGGVAGETTGGWTNDFLKWVEIGKISFEVGDYVLRIDRNDVFPHIHSLRLVPVD
nr:hypothetical protein [uncultured Albidiferax sp.]